MAILLMAVIPKVQAGNQAASLTIGINKVNYRFQNSEKPGKIAGLVVNVTTGEAIPGVTIEILGRDNKVSTDADGNFSFSLPAGVYQIRATYPGFNEIVKEVMVVAGEFAPVDLVLAQEGARQIEDVVEVQAGNNSNTIAVLEERRAATTISEIVSREEISKDSSSDVAGVLQKVPGLSVVDNKFVYVRGLGDRYSNTVLNDALLPTPQPDRRVVPLDQVPSELIQSLKILKTFTPDQPGEFAGGLVKIETLEFPNRTTFKISSSVGGNTNTTFQNFLAAPGARFDFLGFGLGRRRLPDALPNTPLRRGSQLIPGFSAQQLQNFGQAFENVYEPRQTTAPLNQNVALAGSTQIGKLGLVGNITYGNNSQQLTEVRNFFRVARDSQGNRTIFAPTRYSVNSGNNNVRLGGIATAAYKVNSDAKLVFKQFFSNDANDESRTTNGFFDDRGSQVQDSRLRYVLTRTSTSQLAGDFVLPQLGNAILNVRYTFSRATFNEPDLRGVIYEFDPSLGKFVFFDTGQSGLRMFSDLEENVREPAFDLSKFFFASNSTLNLKLGYSFSNRDRRFNSRRFRFFTRGTEGVDRSAAPETLFAAENITPDRFEVGEDTRPTDFYVASQDITAGYFLGDYTIRKFRFIGGVRIERSKQQVLTLDQFAVDATPITADLDNTDLLPSIGIVYNLTPSINLRTGYSQTVSRPQFRELSPFEFTDITGGRSTIGNPNLKRAKIRNFDVRTEYLKGPNVLAFSFFYKDLQNPIEIVVEPTTALRTSFRNVNGATNRGIELEARQALGQLNTRLANLAVNFNYTFVDSNIDIGTQSLSVLTSKQRPLAGQSRHLVNASLDYDFTKQQISSRLIFNYTGARISDVGSFDLPDIIEKGFPSLDLLITKKLGGDGRWEVKFSGDNLLNRLVRFKVEDQPFQVFRRGRNFSVGVSYNFF
jgi:outer membrane receptor protein involved in Fe transport